MLSSLSRIRPGIAVAVAAFVLASAPGVAGATNRNGTVPVGESTAPAGTPNSPFAGTYGEDSGAQGGANKPADAIVVTGGVTRFGVMLGDTSAKAVAIATGFEAQVLRKQYTASSFTGTCSECVAWRDAGIDFVLTVRSNGTPSTASSPVTDFATYRTQLARVLDVVQPAVLVVENEEDAANFYSGTAAQYLAQLGAACEVAHARGIECTNGGLASPMATTMTYQNFVDTGQAAAADTYARATSMTDEEYQNLVNPWMADNVAARAAEGNAFASGYLAAGADYVNFHWYRKDPAAFSQTVDYLEAFTGLTAMSNEIGQYDEDTGQVSGLMAQAAADNLAYAIWYSLDYYVQAVDRTTRALNNPSGSHRQHGTTYASFMNTYRGTAGERQLSAAGEITTARHGNKLIRLYGTISGDPACGAGQTVKIQQATDLTLKFWTTKYTVTTDAAGNYTSPAWSFGKSINIRAMAVAAGPCRMGLSPWVLANPLV